MSDDERWRKMTPTEREKNVPIIEECLQPLFDRIAELEAQVTRLQDAYNAALGDVEWLVPYDQINWDENHREYGLHPGDLDPLDGDE